MDFDDVFDSESQDDPEKNESVAAFMTCMSLLNLGRMAKPEPSPELTAAYEPLLPHLWLTLAQATAALAPLRSSNPETVPAVLDLTRRWLAKAMRLAPADAHVLLVAGLTVNDFVDLESIEEAERAKLLEQACQLLQEASRLAPGRFDILNELGTVLCTQASNSQGPEKAALLRAAVRRFDEAARCFRPAYRRFPESGSLHPDYARAMNGAATARWCLARKCEDVKEKEKLLRRGLKQSRLALEGLESRPGQRLLVGRVAVDLAWLQGTSPYRRELFDEACRALAASVEIEPESMAEACALWGEARVGCISQSTGWDRKELIRESDQLFAKAARSSGGGGAPHRQAARSWLRVAAESSAEEEQDAARRAGEAARRANRVEPGSADYNLACALSRLGQTEEAAAALTRVVARDPEAATAASQDPDLQRLWEAKPDLRGELAAAEPSRKPS